MKYIIDLITQVYGTTYTPEQQTALGIIADVYHKETDNNALITLQGDTVYITFRSTVMDKQNIFEDLFEFPWTKEKTKVGDFNFDAGFYLAWSVLKDQIIATLKTLNCNKVVTVGHSLGAAMAGISTIDLLQLGYNVTDSYLLACPNYVSKNGIDYIDSKKVNVNSYLNYNDAIWFVALFLTRSKFIRIGKPTFPIWPLSHLPMIPSHFTWDTTGIKVFGIQLPGTIGYITALKNYFGDKY